MNCPDDEHPGRERVWISQLVASVRLPNVPIKNRRYSTMEPSVAANNHPSKVQDSVHDAALAAALTIATIPARRFGQLGPGGHHSGQIGVVRPGTGSATGSARETRTVVLGRFRARFDLRMRLTQPEGNGGLRRVRTGSFANDRGGTRTLDQRINLPHRLSPTTLCSSSASRRIRKQGVDGLDYLFAIAGVPRLVSGAGAGDPLVPCLLITQSPCFSNPHASRCQPRCGEGALRAFQHTAAFTRRGSVSSRARLLCNTPGGA